MRTRSNHRTTRAEWAAHNADMQERRSALLASGQWRRERETPARAMLSTTRDCRRVVQTHPCDLIVGEMDVELNDGRCLTLTVERIGRPFVWDGRVWAYGYLA